MRWLSAGLTFVNFSTIFGLLFGIIGHGLGSRSATAAILIGTAAAVAAFLATPTKKTPRRQAPPPEPEKRLSKRAMRRAKIAPPPPTQTVAPASQRYRHIWVWIMAACFALFAFRSFCWLFYIDGPKFKIQSPNNLGDLSLHIAYIKTFASGVRLWPENPIYIASNLRYPAGTDLFNAILLCAGVDIIRGLVWAGLLGSLGTCYALYRWSGCFGIAGFVFNGGLAGFQFFKAWQFLDYQGDKTIGWKSIPLSMFVTQRGLLYAIPAGLLLLCHWRAKFMQSSDSQAGTDTRKPIIPFWVELSLYASMPLFHVHTFLALSILLGWWVLVGTSDARRRSFTLIAAAFVPATLVMWVITDHFHARSILAWSLGWVQRSGDFAAPFFRFWIVNFGLTLPLFIGLVGFLGYTAWKRRSLADFRISIPLVFVTPAVLLFLFACTVKTAPWEWDNMKLIIWAYLMGLPFAWSELIAKWPWPIRAGVCISLFASGFVTMVGGLAAGKTGFDLADRTEVDGVGAAVRKLPLDARFASYPTYNNPLLLNGRKVVLGYPGHLWTQGFDYGQTEKKLNALMLGTPTWLESARELQTRYLLWGPNEKANYRNSTRPWEKVSLRVATGKWGALYDLEKAAPPKPNAIR
jgi:hypothetical protein